MEDLSKQISETILAVATNRGTCKSTCPSEIARILFPEDWRKHMKAIVDIAIDLQHQGKVLITQKGLPIDVDDIKGPIRIKIS
ncbi:DUF3253 domain-containing protein [Pedobacter namyangjuensis]|uniref:DUF3253 domain-containing protein n=1 Tax=Pedobacter namyangjuensis TaxID=600626 RepID=UPI000DE222F0|nr:DUF3253 domain-containing protein [Pedobacter namyangjuensis]